MKTGATRVTWHWRGSLKSLAVIGPFQIRDVELVHAQDRRHDPARPSSILVLHHLAHNGWHDLPGKAELVLEPAASPLPAESFFAGVPSPAILSVNDRFCMPLKSLTFPLSVRFWTDRVAIPTMARSVPALDRNSTQPTIPPASDCRLTPNLRRSRSEPRNAYHTSPYQARNTRCASSRPINISGQDAFRTLQRGPCIALPKPPAQRRFSWPHS
jgi:hypothetical protein